jgi:group I intron endonuclease
MIFCSQNTHCSGVVKLSNKESKANYVVYKHTCTVTNKSYVGITNNFRRRCREHVSRSSEFAFSRAIKKHGWKSFKSELLAIGLTKASANHFEKYYIIRLNTIAPHGYNLASGGDDSTHCSDTIQRMRESQRGEKSHRFGKLGSDSDSSKEYIVIFPSGKVEIIKGLAAFCRDNGIKYYSNASSVATGRYFHANGFKFEYYIKGKYSDEELLKKGESWPLELKTHKRDVSRKNRSKVVTKIGPDNKNSKKYLIISQYGELLIIKGLGYFCDKYNITESAIREVISCKKRHHKGYYAEHYIDGMYSDHELKIKCENWAYEFANYKIPDKSGPEHFNSKKYIITHPSGLVEIIQGLQYFCIKHELSDKNMIAVARKRRNHHKNYKCEYCLEEQTKEAA